ncbi:TadE/TadG family type IV pilus assembly protein [Lentzea sp. NPDC004782]|uniref:TadE/TadG family type IV pilus assembly protein n=1 Tax=Lentzea sp. NPDC004782 TaxID=3154458 RepID=UPI0033B87903
MFLYLKRYHEPSPRGTWLLEPLRRLRSDDRGAGTAELVIATPLLLLLVLLIAQFALYMHATHIAQAAASEALSAARVSGGTAAAGTAEGQRVLAQLGSGPLQGTSVSVRRGPGQVSVMVSGNVINVVPFATLTARAEAVGPVEKFTPQTGTGR